jgi:P4 family phage/plasmid primase-like protien
MTEAIPNSGNNASEPIDYHIRLQALKRIYERIKETGLTTRRFLLVKPREKDPVMPKGMYDKLYDIQDTKLIEHIKRGGNYGIAAIGDGLVMVESDGPPLTAVLKEALPRTFTVLSGGSKNPHFYFIVEDLPKEILTEDKRMKAIPLYYGVETGADGRTSLAHIGMVKIKNSYCVGPGSIHPSGGLYEIQDDVPIARIKWGELITAISTFTRENIDKAMQSAGEDAKKEKKMLKELEIPIERVLEAYNVKLNHGKQLWGSHPVHGSTTGHNFWVNPEKNAWFCFRHWVGGGPISLIALLEGLVKDCFEVKNLDWQTFRKTIEKAIEKKLLPSNALEKIEEKKIKSIKIVKEEPRGKDQFIACLNKLPVEASSQCLYLASYYFKLLGKTAEEAFNELINIPACKTEIEAKGGSKWWLENVWNTIEPKPFEFFTTLAIYEKALGVGLYKPFFELSYTTEYRTDSLEHYLEDVLGRELYEVYYEKGNELLDIKDEKLRKARALQLAWERVKRPSSSYFIEFEEDEDGITVKIYYGRIERYLLKRFLPISLGTINPVVYIYDGKRFIEEKGEILKEIKAIFRPLIETKEGIARYVNETMRRVEISSAFRFTPFNNFKLDGKYLVPAQNCVVVVGKDSIETTGHSPLFGFSFILGAEYRHVDTSTIDNWFASLVRQEDVVLLYEIPAYCLLYNENWQTMFMLYGEGSNGKSLYMRLLTKMLGEDNVSHIPLQDFQSENRFATIDLLGKLANIYADIPKEALHDTSLIKAISGEDKVPAERKFKDRFFFEPKAKFIFSANTLPMVNDDTFAFWRRWTLIEFPNKFPKNPEFEHRILSKDNVDALLKKAIEHLPKLLERRSLTQTKNTEELARIWEMQANSGKAFVKYCVERDPKGLITARELKDRYFAFCEKYDLESVSEKALGRYLKDRGASHIRVGPKGKREWAYKGIVLKCGECKEKCFDIGEGSEEESDENGNKTTDAVLREFFV